MSERRSDLKAVAAAEELASKMQDHDIVGMTARMMDGWTQVNGRLISLAQVSLRNNLAAAEQLRQCQSPSDVLDTQMKLAREAMDQYMDEAKTIGEILSKISTDAMACMGPQR